MHTAGPHITVLGGGGGAAQVLRAVAPWAGRRSAVIAVTDTGRSTGLARAIARIPAPGDLRSTIAALAPEGLWPRLIEHRLRGDVVPQLEGMAVGNLLIAALAEVTGDFALAVEQVRQLAGTEAEVLPVSTVDAQLCALLADGSTRVGELAVRGLAKPPIQQVFLQPAEAGAYPPALAAIHAADLVVIGPGSLFTSLLATLRFVGVVPALATCRAPVVFVANSTTQPGQTDGMDLADHVAALVALLGAGVLDVALINGSAVDPARAASLAAAGLLPLLPDEAGLAQVRALGVQPLVAPLAEETAEGRVLWNKLDTIRSDPRRLGDALRQLV